MAKFIGSGADEIIIPSVVSSTVTATGGARPSNAARGRRRHRHAAVQRLQRRRAHERLANGGRVRLFRDVGNVTMDLNSVEKIQIKALGGADTHHGQ